jgi:hypothetical protein
MLSLEHNVGAMLLIALALIITIISPGLSADLSSLQSTSQESSILETPNDLDDSSGSVRILSNNDDTSVPQDDLARLLGDDGVSLARPPKWCKYNLKDYTKYEWHWQQDYEVFRDPDFEHLWFGKGPDKFYNYNLPRKFHHICGSPPSRPKILSFYLRLPKNKKRYIKACIGHHDSHEPEFPHITAYDCNGTAIKCLWGGFKFPKPKELLIVLSPETHEYPDAYWLLFSKHAPPHDFCESYPFFEET